MQTDRLLVARLRRHRQIVNTVRRVRTRSVGPCRQALPSKTFDTDPRPVWSKAAVPHTPFALQDARPRPMPVRRIERSSKRTPWNNS